MQKDWGLRDGQDGTVYFNLLKTQSRTSGRTVIWNSCGHGGKTLLTENWWLGRFSKATELVIERQGPALRMGAAIVPGTGIWESTRAGLDPIEEAWPHPAQARCGVGETMRQKLSWMPSQKGQRDTRTELIPSNLNDWLRANQSLSPKLARVSPHHCHCPCYNIFHSLLPIINFYLSFKTVPMWFLQPDNLH